MYVQRWDGFRLVVALAPLALSLLLTTALARRSVAITAALARVRHFVDSTAAAAHAVGGALDAVAVVDAAAALTPSGRLFEPGAHHLALE